MENTFGMLKGRLKILLKRVDIPLCHMPNLVMICICLHNMCIINSNGFDMHWALQVQRLEVTNKSKYNIWELERSWMKTH
jgi:hypothetical protein